MAGDANGSEEVQEQHPQGQSDDQEQHQVEEKRCWRYWQRRIQGPSRQAGGSRQGAREPDKAVQSKVNADKLMVEIEQMRMTCADERCSTVHLYIVPV